MTMVTRHRRRPDERGRYWALCDVRGDQSAEGGLIAAAARRAFCCITFHISAEVESEFVGIHERWRERAKVVLRKGPDRGSIKEPKTEKPSENRLRVATIRDQLSPSRHLTFGAHRQTAPGGRRCDLLRAGLPAILFGRRPRECGRTNLFLDPQPASARPSNLF
jgi:hypothetical protein